MRHPFVAGVAVGALAAYFLVPDAGRRRRRAARERSAAELRHARKRLVRTARVRAAFVRGRTLGLAHRVRPTPPVEVDDVTLAHKVETVLFRDDTVPKGQISINAEEGAVFLRGEVESDELIHRIERDVRRIAGVRDVENLLHLPGTPAPHAAPPG